MRHKQITTATPMVISQLKKLQQNLIHRKSEFRYFNHVIVVARAFMKQNKLCLTDGTQIFECPQTFQHPIQINSQKDQNVYRQIILKEDYFHNILQYRVIKHEVVQRGNKLTQHFQQVMKREITKQIKQYEQQFKREFVESSNCKKINQIKDKVLQLIKEASYGRFKNQLIDSLKETYMCAQIETALSQLKKEGEVVTSEMLNNQSEKVEEVYMCL